MYADTSRCVADGAVVRFDRRFPDRDACPTTHRMISVEPIQLVSASFGVAVADHAEQPAGICPSRLVATEDLGRR
jgi:hypothetical protein